jgi:uncharacterized membrane protein
LAAAAAVSAAAEPEENGNMKAFIRQIDQTRIEQAVAAAERLTSGEIRVVILPGKIGDPLQAAEAEFSRLGMQQTRERNAVLILIAPDSQDFAIFGDQAVHAKCGDSFWREVAQAMQAHFRAGTYTTAIIEGIERAGRLLAKEFPRRPDDTNELPDRVIVRHPVI